MEVLSTPAQCQKSSRFYVTECRSSIYHSQDNLSRVGDNKVLSSQSALPASDSGMPQGLRKEAEKPLVSVCARAKGTSHFEKPQGPAKSDMAIAVEYVCNTTTMKAKEEIIVGGPLAFKFLTQKIAAEIASRRAAQEERGKP